MSSGAALISMFGPMLEIGARVLFAIAPGLLALVALRISARAICQGDAGVFLVGWAFGIVGDCGAWIGFASLVLYRIPPMLQGVPDSMSGAGFWGFVQACEAPIALAVGSGVLIALCLRHGRRVGAAAGSSRDREARSRRIGAVGEARVAAELNRIGLPALHNVILRGARWSVELDHVVRVPSGIVVLETKTFGGTIEGQLDSRLWTQRTAGGVELGRWTIRCCRTRRMYQRWRVSWATCGCRYAVTSSRPGARGLHRRSRTQSFPFDIYGGCCRLSLPRRVRAFSMRRGGGSRARQRKTLAAVRRTRLTRAGGATRSEFGVRGDYLCA
jgi:hypothetical protein